jgi:alpha-beta hydrolase superfamily lysophospholipase
MPNPDKITHKMAQIIDWINEHIQEVISKRAYGVEADLENTVLMGHSAGGHVITEYLNHTCGKVKAQIMISPVDGADPFGIIQKYIITPGKMLPYATPVLILAAGLDPVSRLLEPPCAPANLSNDR